MLARLIRRVLPYRPPRTWRKLACATSLIRDRAFTSPDQIDRTCRILPETDCRTRCSPLAEASPTALDRRAVADSELRGSAARGAARSVESVAAGPGRSEAAAESVGAAGTQPA